MINLYCGGEYSGASAYLIVPTPAGEDVFHQYSCVSCEHFNGKGLVFPLPERIGAKFDAMLGCNPATPEEISKATGFEVTRVLGEALCVLSNGCYVATSNCD